MMISENEERRMIGKKVLITGGLGFIGSNLAKRCLDLGAEVTIFDNMMPDTGANMFNIKDFEDKVEVIIGDIRNKSEIGEAVEGKDIIFNLAAQVSHVLSMEDPLLDIDINCKGHINLLEACKEKNPDVVIVYTGTRTQVGKVEGGIADEKCVDNPSDIYGAGKLASEIYHLIYGQAYGMKTCSLRLTNIYGPRAQIKNPKYGVINWFMGKAVSGDKVPIYEPGTQLRDVLHVDDAVSALILASLNENAIGEIFLIGSGKGEKMIDIGKKISEYAQTEVELVPWPKERENIEVGDAVLDITKAKEILGWVPRVKLEEGILECINFYKANLSEYFDQGVKKKMENESFGSVGIEEDKLKVLVTGGLGHIGSALIREYAKRDDVGTIRVIDNFLVQRYCSLFDLPENAKFEFIEGDISDLDALEKAVQDIDVVIHLAAITDAPSTLSDKEGTFKVNLEGTKNVLEAALRAGVKKFLFPSTTSVYGEAEGLVDENYPEYMYKPSSPYAEAKKEAERLVCSYKERGLNTNVLRLGTIFGTSIGMRFHTAVNKFCYLAALGKPLTVWDTAINNKRPYLGLKDAIRAFQFVEKNGSPGELYNVLTHNYTVQEMVDHIRRFEPGLSVEITKSPILNQKSYNVSDEKIRRLGFVPEDDLGEAIGSTLKLFKAIKNKD